MIIFFGPAGAGKSIQGQILALRLGWPWLSTGNIFRHSKNLKLQEYLKTGKLVPTETVNEVLAEALDEHVGDRQIILDGYPRLPEQARWLLARHSKIDLVIVIDVPREELMKRLKLRGRADDTATAIDERLAIYTKETAPILTYLKQQHSPIFHVDGSQTIGQVHDQIYEELERCQLI